MIQRDQRVPPLRAAITSRHSVQFSICGADIREKWFPEELDHFSDAALARFIDARHRFLERVARVRGIRIHHHIIVADSEELAQAAELALMPVGGHA